MNLGNFIDIAIVVYLLFNVMMGFRNGLVKSLFVSFGFLLKFFVTYFVYINFSKQILSSNIVKPVIDSIKNVILSMMPNLKIVSGIIDIVILVFLVYLIASIVVYMIFKIINSFADSDMIGITDKMLGALFSFVKAVLVIMFLVYAFDVVADYVITKEIKSMFSKSLILPEFYYYNVFMNENIDFLGIINNIKIK